MEDILAILLIFGGGTVVLLAFSPVGRALAERLTRGAHPSGPDPEVLAEIEQLRHELADVQERLDFTERLLARQRDTAQLGGPGDAGT
jgi:hypothetical protein